MQQQYLSADEVVAILGISKATLYSYVSRGLIRSEETGGKTRARRYVAADVAALQQRKAQRRNPAQSAAAALHFGDPVLESAITLIADGQLYYRGQNALTLAEQATFEEVVALLWTGTIGGIPWDAPNKGLPPITSPLRRTIQTFIAEGNVADALQLTLLVTAPTDLGGYNQTASGVAQTGLRMLHRLTAMLTNEQGDSDDSVLPPPSSLSIAQRLQAAWRRNQPSVAHPLQEALILCADHELNASSFTARCVAATGATPYSAVVAALAALQGYKHGGATHEVATFLREAAVDPERATQARLRAGQTVPGFGHLLYPTGDPRGQRLLALAEQYGTNDAIVAAALRICTLLDQALQMKPNLDFGLVVLAQSLQLPPYAPFALFAMGRTAGWIGHCIEQYETDRLIRPRARYTGRQPE